MASTPAKWLDAHAESVLASQSARANSAKVLATFATGLAAALLGPALQKAPAMTPRLWMAVALFGLAGLLTLTVFALDQIELPDDHAVLAEHAIDPSATPDDLLFRLRLSALTATRSNARLVRRINRVAIAQVLAAVLSATLSILSVIP